MSNHYLKSEHSVTATPAENGWIVRHSYRELNEQGEFHYRSKEFVALTAGDAQKIQGEILGAIEKSEVKVADVSAGID